MSNGSQKSAVRWLWLAGPVIVLDQITKWMIISQFELYERIQWLPILDITRLHNTGAAFSFLSTASGWQRWFFVTLAMAVSIAIMVWIRRLPAKGESLLAAGLSLILGGALGNVIDRVSHGFVVDFISVHYNDWHFPAFNIADSAITVGAALLIIDAFFSKKERQT